MKPLAALTDLLRRNLGLSPFWWLQLAWLTGLMVLFAILATRAIYPQLVK